MRGGLDEALAQVLEPGEKWALGGGTVLVAQWQHRETTDIDLKLEPTEREGRLEVGANEHYIKSLEALGGGATYAGKNQLVTTFGDSVLDLFESRSRPHASPCFCRHQITPKTSRYTRCSMSMLPNVSINRRTRSSGQLGRWWYSISPCRNNECVRRFTVFAFNQRS